MAAFHDVRFPLRLSLGTTGGPVRRTDIVNLSNGREHRNQRWRNSRRVYDAGSGLRSLADLYAVLAFFEARGGQLYGFRFRDPLDCRSGPPHLPAAASEQQIGIGDGETLQFQLTKTYADGGGSFTRVIAKPVEGTVLLSVGGVGVAASDVSVDHATGAVAFATGHAPAKGAIISAGFEFDVPVRFDTERIDVNLSAFEAGRIPTIPLVEISP